MRFLYWLDILEFSKLFYLAVYCTILHCGSSRGQTWHEQTLSPVKGLPGSVVANEIMRNLWVCFTNTPRCNACCNIVLFDYLLSKQQFQTFAGKLSGWLRDYRIEKLRKMCHPYRMIWNDRLMATRQQKYVFVGLKTRCHLWAESTSHTRRVRCCPVPPYTPSMAVPTLRSSK